MDILISVIVPIYNTEQYLALCLESLVNQNFESYELLLIDDGSTDSSGELAEDYAIRYPNLIRTFHKENGGLSDARNYGLKYARGKFVSFVDSDDWVDVRYLADLYYAYEKYQTPFVAANYTEYSDSNQQYLFAVLEKDYFEKVYTVQEALELETYKGFHLQTALSTVSWRKLYDKKLFDNISFSKDQIHENSYTTYQLLIKAGKVTFLNKPLYYYRIDRNGSIMEHQQKSLERAQAIIDYNTEKIALLAAMNYQLDQFFISYNWALSVVEKAYLTQGNQVKAKHYQQLKWLLNKASHVNQKI